jgi:hypothetical protein
MNQQIQTATLCLSTYDGNCISNTAWHTNWTWKGINLRLLLGNMYNQYDYFNLVLCSISTLSASIDLGANDGDLNLIAKISGLPFMNQGYNTSTGMNTNKTTLIPLNFKKGYPLIINDCYNSILTFNKQQEVVDLNIFYERYDYFDIFSEAYYPDAVFLFKIVGVKQNDEIINHRMKI